MEVLFLIIGIVIGTVSIWFYLNSKTNEKIQLNNIENEKKLIYEKELRIKAEAKIEAFENSRKKQDENIKNSFVAFANEAIKSNNENFIKLAEQTLSGYITKANYSNEINKKQIENILKPLHESLEKHEKLVKDLEKNSANTFGSITSYIDELGKKQQSLEKETSALVNALKAPKVRGRWGEIGLRRIVEFSGLSKYCDFSEQVNINANDQKYRPDLIVNLPDNKHIIVDSKVPLEAYLNALETDDTNTKKDLLKAHSRAVSQHVKDLSSKSYWAQFDDSIDFVVLYIEVESAFGAALIENKNLITDAIKNRVIFATPTTLIALLQTVAFTWKQHTATENALAIWKSANELYERMAIFTEYLDKIGSNISQLTKTYNQAIGSWESRVVPSFRKIETMGINSEKKQINELSDVEISTRQLKEKKLKDE